MQKILISAFVCTPTTGGEGGTSWNLAARLADFHEIWIITQTRNRAAIEKHLATHPVANLHIIFHEIPGLHKVAQRLSELFLLRPYISNLYYYLWQLAIYPVVLNLHAREQFNLTHHFSYKRYWMPSLLCLLPVPFVWGTVSGADTIPKEMMKELPARAFIFESVRTAMIRLATFDPLVRLTARRSAAALAFTPATISKLRSLGAKNVLKVYFSGLDVSAETPASESLQRKNTSPVRLISVGRLIHWKGYHLSLRALAKCPDLDLGYWIFGEGVEQNNLENLCRELKIQDRVRFFGFVPRQEVLQAHQQAQIFVHPSLHEPVGGAALEAMARGLPVICLDLAGSSISVTDQTGIKIPAKNPEQVVSDLAGAMRKLALDPALRSQMGLAGRQRFEELFTWEAFIPQLLNIYEDFCQPPEKV